MEFPEVFLTMFSIVKWLVLIGIGMFAIAMLMTKFRKSHLWLLLGASWLGFISWFPGLAFHPASVGVAIISVGLLGVFQWRNLPKRDVTAQAGKGTEE